MAISCGKRTEKQVTAIYFDKNVTPWFPQVITVKKVTGTGDSTQYWFTIKGDTARLNGKTLYDTAGKRYVMLMDRDTLLRTSNVKFAYDSVITYPQTKK